MAMGMMYANPGGTISWGGEFPKNQVDWAINRAYARLVSDLGDIELLTNTVKMFGSTGVSSYTLNSPPREIPNTFSTRGSCPRIIVTVPPVAAGTTYSLLFPLYSLLATYDAGDEDTEETVATQLMSQLNDYGAATGRLVAYWHTTQSTFGDQPRAQFTLSVTTPGVVTNVLGYTMTVQNLALFDPVTNAASTLLSGGTSINAGIRMVRRVYYQPVGAKYRLELEPGARLISWEEFQRKTSAGYLLPNSFTDVPDFCSVNPTRTRLYFYGAPAQNGDVITVEYCPIITSSPPAPNTANIPASLWGTLQLDTDVPPLPEDAQDAIWEGAVSLLMPKAREYEGGRSYAEIYKADVQRIKDNYTRDSAGDALVLRPAEDALATSGTNFDLGDF